MQTLPTTTTLTPASEPAHRPMAYAFRRLRINDLPALRALRNQVLAQLPDPDLYVRESNETHWLQCHLRPERGGHAIGVFVSAALVAYAFVRQPPTAEPDLLRSCLGSLIPAQASVAHIASCMVHPAHRGQGLQPALLKQRFAIAQKQGADFCIAATSPRNQASLHNLLGEGMRLAWVGPLDGLERCVLVRRLAPPDIGPQHSAV